MGQKRTPVLRKPTPKEELQKLHPFERVLIRLFEFFSSVKLAIVLMLWLMIECTIGTFVESQVNTPAARYFVYGTWHFMLLLSLLGLNILCAALIRFPWKFYQTGFLVTHLGLLVLLTGSMITALTNVDALMQVEQGKAEDHILNPDEERLVVSYHDKDGKSTYDQVIPVRFGPFTWGHKLWGTLPWRDGHVEEHTLTNGDTLRVKNFYANCDRETVYVPAEDGVPAVRFRLYHPQRVDMTQWLAVDPQTMFGVQSLMMGSMVMWQVATAEELDHFVKAVPRDDNVGLRGTLAYSHAGKHHVFRVDELQKGPVPIPGTHATLQVTAYLPNAKIKHTNKGDDWVSVSDDPLNPLLKIKLQEGDKEAEEYLAFGAHPEWSPLLATRYGREHLFTYFPTDQGPVMHLVITPTGKAGYRAFGSQGLIAADYVEKGRNYASWAGWTFTPLDVLASATEEVKLRPKRLPRAKTGNPGIIVELQSSKNPKDVVRTALTRGMGRTRQLGNRAVQFRYDIAETKLPFQIRLDEFKEPKNPGTNQAAMYTSIVTLIDKAKDLEKNNIVITMNAPLHWQDDQGKWYTFYQSGIDYSMGKPVSTYTVARDPGLILKYVGLLMVICGIILMFYLGGYFRRHRFSARRSAKVEATSEAALVFADERDEAALVLPD